MDDKMVYWMERQELIMKPVVGIGSNTKYGRVLKVQHDGVVVENSRGEREVVSFRKIESTLKGVKK